MAPLKKFTNNWSDAGGLMVKRFGDRGLVGAGRRRLPTASPIMTNAAATATAGSGRC